MSLGQTTPQGYNKPVTPLPPSSSTQVTQAGVRNFYVGKLHLRVALEDFGRLDAGHQISECEAWLQRFGEWMTKSLQLRQISSCCNYMAIKRTCGWCITRWSGWGDFIIWSRVIRDEDDPSPDVAALLMSGFPGVSHDLNIWCLIMSQSKTKSKSVQFPIQ